MFRGSVKGTGYPLHSPVSPSLPLPCAITFQLDSTNGRVHLNRPVGASVQSTAGSRDVCISGSNAVYTMFRGSVKSTGYPLHSPVSPSLSLQCVTVCHHISTGVYKRGNNSRDTLNRVLDVPRGSAGRFGGEKNLLNPCGIRITSSRYFIVPVIRLTLIVQYTLL